MNCVYTNTDYCNDIRNYIPTHLFLTAKTDLFFTRSSLRSEAINFFLSFTQSVKKNVYEFTLNIYPCKTWKIRQ